MCLRRKRFIQNKFSSVKLIMFRLAEFYHHQQTLYLRCVVNFILALMIIQLMAFFL